MHYTRQWRGRPLGKPGAYTCLICDSEQARTIDGLLASGMSCDKVAARTGLVGETVRRHASRHLGIVMGRKGQCTVCTHPDLDDIERAMSAGCSSPWIAARSEVSADAVHLHRHNHVGSVEVAAFLAARQLSLLRAAEARQKRGYLTPTL